MQQTSPYVKYVTIALSREDYDHVRTIARRWKWANEAVLELWVKRGMNEDLETREAPDF